MAETKQAFFSLNPKKAPGLDNIDAIILRQTYWADPLILHDWANKCMELWHFPKPPRSGQFVYFLKTYKDQGVHSSYRPTCLIPSLGKMLKKILAKRLMYFLETNDLLS